MKKKLKFRNIKKKCFYYKNKHHFIINFSKFKLKKTKKPNSNSTQVPNSSLSWLRAYIKSCKNLLIENKNIRYLRIHLNLLFDFEITQVENNDLIIILHSNNHIIIQLFAQNNLKRQLFKLYNFVYFQVYNTNQILVRNNV